MNFWKLPIRKCLMHWPKSSSVRYNSKVFAMNRAGKTLSRLVIGKGKTKHKWCENSTPILQSHTSISNPKKQGKGAIRRVKVLNKLFMRHVSDFMLCDDKWSGYGLEITKVEIASDFNLLNVFWIARDDVCDKLEVMLANAARPLRHELSQLQLMGEVPLIIFVKDREYSKYVEVDRLLRIADYGDDYVPPRPSDIVKNDLLSAHNSELPDMAYDVLGLNRLEIMSKIKQNMKKTKQAWEKYETEDREEIDLNSTEKRAEQTIRLKEEEFQAFLIKRKHENRIRKSGRIVNHNEEDDDDSEDEFNDLDDEFQDDTYYDDDVVDNVK